jgi:hypothetical protein
MRQQMEETSRPYCATIWAGSGTVGAAGAERPCICHPGVAVTDVAVADETGAAW